ncbi:hypothetical protein [uncultured Cellulomonas sp.]|uniref:hypothetical protein n=1 Tax=uncultured Cellulomonas sp. TaxID=189682 RepID=UPI0028EE8CCF|nr:hypothetical protein [uncultured Cellulomonas sp.]
MKRTVWASALLSVVLAASAVPLATAASAASCGTVHGTVTDEHTGVALPGMLVEVVGIAEWAGQGVVASATSAADGSFAIPVTCANMSATTRTTDPSGFYGPRYGGAGTDVESGSGFWLGGNGEDVAQDRSVRLTAPGRLVPVEPTRVIDTREDAEGPLGPGEVARFLLDELPDHTVAVVLNLTATQGTASTSFVSALSYQYAEPRTSVINSSAGRDVANLVTVPVSRYSESGVYEVVLYNNAGYTHLVADLQGIYSSDEGAGFQPIAPTRVLDTRDSSPLGPRGTRSLVLAGPGKVAPADAVAAAVTITSTRATARTSYVSAYPSDATDGPSTSVLNAYQNDDIPNLAIVPLGPDGALTLYNDQGSTDIVVDVVGWFVESGGADYYPIEARRAVGSRTVDTGRVLEFTADSAQVEVRDDAVAMSLNLTTASASKLSYLTVYPTGTTRPFASNANARPGADIATGVLTRLGAGAAFSVYNNSGDVLALVDVSGYFAVND